MKPVVYIDVLFFVNFILNYILLWTTAKIGRLRTKRIRIVIGAVFGSVYAVLMFFPNLSFVYTTAAKLLFSLAVVAVTYNIKGIRLYFRTLGIFYVVTFSFGGGAFALFYFTDAGAKLGALISNGILYINLPWQLLFLSIGISYIILRLVLRAVQNRISKDNMYARIIILLNGEQVEINALLDTGNSLYDPISHYPVIVAEYDRIKTILPYELKNVFEKGGEINLEALSIVLSNTTNKFRLIPFNSLGRENGMLLGFKPDGASLIENETIKQIGDVIVGIYNKSLANDKSYCALLHPGVINS